jgi:hypothetical protein
MTVTTHQRPSGGPQVNIQGSDFDALAACTTDVGTTAEIDKRGFTHGSVYVPTGSLITLITWYATRASGVTGRPAKEFERAVISQIVAADEDCELHPSLAGMGFVLPVVNAAGDLYFHFER